MGLFSNKKKYATVSVKDTVKPPVKREKEEVSSLWVKCDDCGEIIYKEEISKNLKKCPSCDHYFPMSAKERIELLIDINTFEEYDEEIRSKNPLDFPEYENKLDNARKKKWFRFRTYVWCRGNKWNRSKYCCHGFYIYGWKYGFCSRRENY